MTARDQIEPAALVDIDKDEARRLPTEREIEQSKAISLRRIADAVEALAHCVKEVEGDGTRVFAAIDAGRML